VDIAQESKVFIFKKDGPTLAGIEHYNPPEIPPKTPQAAINPTPQQPIEKKSPESNKPEPKEVPKKVPEFCNPPEASPPSPVITPSVPASVNCICNCISLMF
jgi:hypothetical protein